MSAMRNAVLLARLRLGYAAGTLLSRATCAAVGHESRIHLSVQIFPPKNVYIGKRCEIRRFCYLDARSERSDAIRIGDGCRLKQGVLISTYGGWVSLGKEVLVGSYSTLLGHGGLTVGDFSMIGPGCCILSAEHLHVSGTVPYQKQGLCFKGTTIGRNVYIGANVTIVSGVTIGDNAVIGANSAVTANVEADVLAAGIPAAPICLVSEIPQSSNGDIREYKWQGMFSTRSMYHDDD